MYIIVHLQEIMSNRSDNNNSPVYAPVGQNEDRFSEDGSHLHDDSSSEEEEEEEPVLSEEVIAQLKQNDPNLTLLKIEFVEYGLLRSSTDWPTVGKLIGSNNHINELHVDGNSGNDGSRKVHAYDLPLIIFLTSRMY